MSDAAASRRALRAERYDARKREIWDAFLAERPQLSFMFRRSYMDYHADRFQDSSLLLWRGDRLAALLPADAKDGCVRSHGGLTYGGLLVDPAETGASCIELFRRACESWRQDGFESLIYKKQPLYWNSLPWQGDEYVLFLAEARLIRREMSLVLKPGADFAMQGRKERSIKKAAREGVQANASSGFRRFWREILEPSLMRRHGAKPVHSADEIELLAARHPGNIRLHVAVAGEELLAGIVIFKNGATAHAQYICASERGREVGALDLLVSQLLTRDYASFDWLSLGTSNEQEGRVLNRGLADWKQGFGAVAFSHDHYEVDLRRSFEGLKRNESADRAAA